MTNIAKIRLLINDPAGTSQHFTDAEIQAFIDMAGSVKLASALALEAWAASLTESIDSEKIADYSYSKKSASNKLTLALRYREDEASEPASGWAELDFSE
jgi:hypothetical protein